MAPRIPKPGRDLASLRPDLAKQAYGWDPSSVTVCSGKELDWICPLDHVWNARVSSRKNGSECSVCSGHKVLVGFNDLATLNPELAAQACGWDPTAVTQWSSKEVDWICEKKHTWPATVRARSSGNGCPVCANRKVLIGFNDLATTHPKIASEVDGWDARTVVAGSHTTVDWICGRKKHTWSMTVEKRTIREQNCPYCAGRRVWVGDNDLATTHPEIAEQAYGWDSNTVSRGSDEMHEWICGEKHIWSSTVSNRVAGNQCGICNVRAGHNIVAGINDLATTHPEIAEQAYGWDATTVTHGSDEKCEWVCEKKHTWLAAISSRQRTGCPFCSGLRAWAGFNDLATTHPILADEADGWDTTTVTAGSKKKLKWRCEFGHTWAAAVVSRSAAGQNCPSCTPLGFDPNKPGYLYFIEHLTEDLLQIGISNNPEQRLAAHARRGWTAIDVQGPWGIGEVAHQWEQDILKYLRSHGALFAPGAGIEKFDGYTEAWLRDSFPVNSLKELRALVFDDEEAA